MPVSFESRFVEHPVCLFSSSLSPFFHVLRLSFIRNQTEGEPLTPHGKQQLEAFSSFTLTSFRQRKSKGWEPVLFIWASTRAPSLKAASQIALLVVIAWYLSPWRSHQLFWKAGYSPFLWEFTLPRPLHCFYSRLQNQSNINNYQTLFWVSYVPAALHGFMSFLQPFEVLPIL